MKNFPSLLLPYIFSLRLFASSLSIAVAYLYVFDFLNATINRIAISHILTTFFLIFVEFGSILFLISLFKLLKRMKKRFSEILIILLFFFIAGGFMSVSFTLTTNGASEWVVTQNRKQFKNTKSEPKPKLKLNSIYKKNLQTARFMFDSLSNLPAHQFKTVRIQQINKLEYYKNQVEYYQEQMLKQDAELKADFRKKEKLNNKFIQKYSHKYYEFGILIMVLVFVSNFLMFLLNDIKNNKIKISTIKNIHEYQICNNSPHSIQVEDILKSDLPDKEKIKSLYDANYSQKQIAKYLHISQSTVSRSLNGKI